MTLKSNTHTKKLGSWEAEVIGIIYLPLNLKIQPFFHVNLSSLCQNTSVYSEPLPPFPSPSFLFIIIILISRYGKCLLLCCQKKDYKGKKGKKANLLWLLILIFCFSCLHILDTNKMKQSMEKRRRI